MYSAGLGNPGFLDWIGGLFSGATEWPRAKWRKFQDAWEEFRMLPPHLRQVWVQYQALYEEAERRNDARGMSEAKAGAVRVDAILRSHSSVASKIAEHLPTWKALDAGEPVARSPGLGSIAAVAAVAAIAALAWIVPRMFQILSNATLEYTLYRKVEQRVLTAEQARSLRPPQTEGPVFGGGMSTLGWGAVGIAAVVVFAGMRK